jgi:hypothetical protein
MLKKFNKFLVFIALTLLCFAAPNDVSAQDENKIVSGDYESLILGVNSKGDLTGYFNEGTGDDGNGNPRFTCTFFIYGAKETGGIYKIKTWYPEFPEEVVEGELKFVKVGIKNGVNIKLDGEHGGCWNVVPVLKDESGVDFSLSSEGNWESVRMISPKRAYLFKSFDAGAPQKIYIVKNDVVRVLQIKGDMAEISYHSANGKTIKGWVKTTNFYRMKL